MKRLEKLKDNALNMQLEYQVNNRKICRKIDAIFLDELNHFEYLFTLFNQTHDCISETDFSSCIKRIKLIFDECKVILVENYQNRFSKNVEELISTMYDFFCRKLNNPRLKAPSKEIDKYLSQICKFECFRVENKLEDLLLDFSDEFIYMFINSDDAKRDFMHMMNNLNHSVVCELKKAISDSIEEKQEIAMRYNRLNKGVLTEKEEIR